MKIKAKKVEIKNPEDVFNIMKEVYRTNDEFDKDREQLYLMCVDARMNLLSLDLISLGTINESLISPREIYRTALSKNAVSVILIHNHPSGSSEPSEEDITATVRVKEAGNILGIALQDHIVIGDNNFTSMRALGLIK